MTSAANRTSSGRLARFEASEASGNYGHATDLPWHSRAVIEGHTLYPSSVKAPQLGSTLVSGEHNAKIGKRVEKGAWAGWPIYTLTLEERETCSRSCHHWRTCYGSNMPFARRHEAGPVLEDVLDEELAQLQRKHSAGFVVRLHVLGDFYSVDYVSKWRGWLQRFPALHCFGYTTWPPTMPIGAAVRQLATERWDRFAIRLSLPQRGHGTREAVTLWSWPATEEELDDAIVCPGQMHKTETCGTCTLCWSTSKNIGFVIHGRKPGMKAKAQPEAPQFEQAESPSPAQPVLAPGPERGTSMQRVAHLLAGLGYAKLKQLRQDLPDLSRTSIGLSLQRLKKLGKARCEGNTSGATWYWASGRAESAAEETPSEGGPGSAPAEDEALDEASTEVQAEPGPVAAAVGRTYDRVRRVLQRRGSAKAKAIHAELGDISFATVTFALRKLRSAGLAELTGKTNAAMWHWKGEPLLHVKQPAAETRDEPPVLAEEEEPEYEIRDAEPAEVPPSPPVSRAKPLADPVEIEKHIAAHGVTKCPPAYAEAVAGANEPKGRLPHYTPEPGMHYRQYHPRKA